MASGFNDKIRISIAPVLEKIQGLEQFQGYSDRVNNSLKKLGFSAEQIGGIIEKNIIGTLTEMAEVFAQQNNISFFSQGIKDTETFSKALSKAGISLKSINDKIVMTSRNASGLSASMTNMLNFEDPQKGMGFYTTSSSQSMSVQDQITKLQTAYRNLSTAMKQAATDAQKFGENSASAQQSAESVEYYRERLEQARNELNVINQDENSALATIDRKLNLELEHTEAVISDTQAQKQRATLAAQVAQDQRAQNAERNAAEREYQNNLAVENKNVQEYISILRQRLGAEEKLKSLEKQYAGSDNAQTKKGLAAQKEYVALLRQKEQELLKLVKGTTAYKNKEEEINRLEAQYRAEIANSNIELKKHNSLLGTFKDTFRMVVQSGLSWRIFSLFTQGATKAVDAVKELDKSLTNLQIVTNGTTSEAKQMLDTYNQIAIEMGSTTRQVADASVEWLRQGYSASEAAELTKNSMVLSKVGAVDSAQATEYLTSALKGYKIEASNALSIIDKLTSIDLVAATSSGDLAEAMSRTANSANLAGVSMDKLLGYIATVAEVTQKSASSVGESFKTIFARFGQIKAGKFIDDETGDDLSDVQKVLAEFNIQLYDTAGNMMNVGDIVDTLSTQWSTYNDVQKNALSTAIAGTRQRENFIVLMENYSNALRYENVAMDSAGTASQKYQAYLNSVEAKQNELTATFEKFSQTLVDRGVISGFYDLGIGALNLASSLTKLLPVVKMLMVVGLGVGISKLVRQIPKLVNWVKTLGTGFDLLKYYGLQATHSENLLNAGITNTELAAKGAAAASSALSVAIGAITAVISVAIMAINNYNQKLDEQVQKAKTETQEAQTQARTIRSLISEYDSYAQKANLDETDYNRLDEIQQQLNDHIDEQQLKVDLVNGSYEEQKKKLDEINEKQKRNTQTQLLIEQAAAKRKALKTSVSMSEWYQSMVNPYYSTFKSSGMDEKGNAIVDLDAVYDNYKKLVEQQSKLADKQQTDTKKYEQISDAIELLKKRYGDYFNAVDALAELEDSKGIPNTDRSTTAINNNNKSVQKSIDLSKQYQNTLKYATTLIDKQIKALQKEKEAIEEANKETQKQLDLYDKALAYINKTVDSKIKALEDEKKALSKKNDESERELKLQELKDNLEKAKRNKIRTYSEDRGWYWTEDLNAVAEAQKALDEEQAEKDLDSQTEAIDNAINEWEKYKEALGTVTTAYEESVDYKAFLNNQSFITEKGINAKDLSEVERFKNAYSSKQKQIAENTTDSIDKRIKDYQNLKEEYEKIAEDFELSNLAQYAALTAGANYQEKVLSGRLARCKAFVKGYNEEMAKLNQNDSNTQTQQTQSNLQKQQSQSNAQTQQTQNYFSGMTGTHYWYQQNADGTFSLQKGYKETAFESKASTIYAATGKSVSDKNGYTFIQLGEAKDNNWVRVKTEKLTNGTYKLTSLHGGNRKGFATGTKSSPSGLYNLNELGDELVVPPSQGNYQFLQKGTGVLNHGLTERLMTMAENPYSYIKSSLSQMGISPNNTSSTKTITIGTINLPQVHNANDFIRELQIITQNR